MDKKINHNSFSSILANEVMKDFKETQQKPNLHGNKEANGTVAAQWKTQDEIQQKIIKLESLLNLYSDLHRQSENSQRIKVLKKISRKVFYEQYYFTNRPVILRSFINDWPAMKKWSPGYFSEHFGKIPVEITHNREKDAAYEKNFHRNVTTIPFADFIELITKAQSSNDVYLVARNYFFSNPRFLSLKKDIKPPAAIVDPSYQGTHHMKLWFGPRGTVTPLHHDKHSILFAQVYGRKHFKMIPSFDLPKIYNNERYYSEVDPENIDVLKYPDFLKASLIDVVVNPGDMLFIPVGWWHWVRSLDISISVTFSNFYAEGFNTEWKCL